MATGRGLTQIYGPGELFINPTDLTGTSGTGLGYTADGVFLRPGFAVGECRADERGVELLKEVFAGCDWTLTAMLIQWNSNVSAQLFPGVLPYSGSKILGTEIAPVKLLWVPDDKTVVPAIYFRKAVPHVEAAAAIQFALGQDPKPVKFPVVFRNASAQDSVPASTVQIALLAGITL